MTLQERLRSPKAGNRLAATEAAADAIDAKDERIRELEGANNHLVQWKAQIIHGLIAAGIAKPEHENSPRLALRDLIAHELAREALK